MRLAENTTVTSYGKLDLVILDGLGKRGVADGGGEREQSFTCCLASSTHQVFPSVNLILLPLRPSSVPRSLAGLALVLASRGSARCGQIGEDTRAYAKPVAAGEAGSMTEAALSDTWMLPMSFFGFRPDRHRRNQCFRHLFWYFPRTGGMLGRVDGARLRLSIRADAADFAALASSGWGGGGGRVWAMTGYCHGAGGGTYARFHHLYY